MNRRSAIAVCLIAILFSSSLSVTVSSSSFTDDQSATDSSVEPIEALKRHIDRQPFHPPPSVDREVEIVVPLQNRTNSHKLSNEYGFVVERVYTEDGQRFARGSISMSDVRSLLQYSRMNRVRITSSHSVSDERVANGVERINADLLQKRGITGENVTVGIIDSDFWISHPSIAQNVGAYYRFDTASNWRHGTAVASVVRDTAPNVNLHLAAVGSTTTPEEYASAVKRLERSGADIIVDAGSYYTQPGDGTGKIAQIAANASSETVFVTSIGNHAQRYWTGNHSSGEWVLFHNRTQANPLNNGNPFSGDVQLTLRWERLSNTSIATATATSTPVSKDYDLYLFRVQPGNDAVVARATGPDEHPIEHLETTVRPGRYYVSIRNATPETNGMNTGAETDTNRISLELFSSRDLQYRSSGGQVAPANAPGVLAVGTSEDGSVESFSARGADLVAPDSVASKGIPVTGGTSFSTSYVAGTAALLLSSYPDLTPKEVRTLLMVTADDIETEGTDPRSGHGRVNATKVVKFMNRTRSDRSRARSEDRMTPHSTNARAHISNPIQSETKRAATSTQMTALRVEQGVAE